MNHKMFFSVLICCLFCQVLNAQLLGGYLVKLETKYGTAVIRLYNQAPRHRENFLKLVNDGYFNRTFFHRIVKDFVIQGGDPDSVYVHKEKLNPQQYWMPPEFNDSLFHKRGVIAMGRDDNPEMSSFSTQFYLVTGKKYTDAEMDTIETRAFKNKYTIPLWQREVYKQKGGAPFLDHHYTVIGELVSGMELLERLNKIPVKKEDVPVEKLPVKLTVL